MKDGKVIDKFVGLKDEADLETFVQKLIGWNVWHPPLKLTLECSRTRDFRTAPRWWPHFDVVL